MNSQQIYEEFTAEIVGLLDAGELPPWRKPWVGEDGQSEFLPRNAGSNRPYRGINVWRLVLTMQARGYTSNRWLTFNQCRKLGGRIIPEQAKKNGGPGPTSVIFWNKIRKDEKDPGTGEMKKAGFMMLKVFRVWNVDQCMDAEGGPLKLPKRRKAVVEIPDGADQDEVAEAVAQGYLERENLKLSHGGSQAYYHSADDYVQIPERETFRNTAGYYSTVFHELGHSTGHTSRLNRDSLTKVCMRGDHTYSREELVAEFTAAFLCGVTGVTMPALVENQAAYLKHWAALLRKEPKTLINAAAAAQNASDRILNHDPSKGAATEGDAKPKAKAKKKPAKKKAAKKKASKKTATKGKKKAPPRVKK